MSNAKQQAVRVLTHYFRVAFTAAGAQWDIDNDVEVGELVGYIIEAVGQEREHKLCAELRAWCENNGLQYASADELLVRYDHMLDSPQRTWLENFIVRWDAMQEAQR